MSEQNKTSISVGEFREQLKLYPDNYEISFCGLDFFRLKQVAPEIVNVEFSQIVYLNEEGNVVVENPE